MKTIDDINLHTWFMDRELEFVPDHFVISKTPVTSDSKIWILEKLTGRFAMGDNKSVSTYTFSGSYPAFEDPKELVFYELTWS